MSVMYRLHLYAENNALESFFIESGMHYSIRKFIEYSSHKLVLTINHSSEDINKIFMVTVNEGVLLPTLLVGDVAIPNGSCCFYLAEEEIYMENLSILSKNLTGIPEVMFKVGVFAKIVVNVISNYV